MITATLDMETIADWHDESRFPPLPYHRPVCVSMLIADSVRQSLELESHLVTPDTSEAEALEAVRDRLVEADRLVTFNGRGFDMPVLQLRAAANFVDWRFWQGRRHRFENFKRSLYHYDLLDQFTDYGAGMRFKLAELAEAFDLPFRKIASGGDVAAMIAAGDYESCARYCEGDVLTTYAAWVHWAGMSGPESARVHLAKLVERFGNQEDK